MTIDEAISRYRNRVEQYKDWHNLKDIAEEHEQLAEWLELLKWYQQGMEDIPSESGVLPKDVYRAGYIKAIDDFFKKIMKYCSMSNMNATMIRQIAEQLKEGAVDG